MDPSYNNSFGSPVISSAGGDIVLQPTPKKKSKVWLILSVIIIVVVAVVGIASYFVFSNTNKNYSYNELFNIYANDVLFGERSPEKKIPEESVGSDMYIYSHYSEADYLDRLGEEYNAFFAKLSDEQRQVMKVYSPAFIFDYLYKYGSVALMDRDELRKVYDEKGMAEAISYIDNYYGSITIVEDEDEEEEDNENEGSGAESEIEEEENGLIENIKIYDALYLRSLVNAWYGGASSTRMQTTEGYKKRQLYAQLDDIEDKIRSTYLVLEGDNNVEK